MIFDTRGWTPSTWTSAGTHAQPELGWALMRTDWGCGYATEAAAAIRRAVRPDGTWLIKDIRSGPAWQDNLRNPVLALMYGLSVTSCLSSGLSEPGGAGLGTLGLHPRLAEQICREAGFSRFTRHDFDDPVNLYYEVRP